jgi:hypothetical protein
MIDFLFSQFKSWLGWLIAGAGGLLVIFFQRWKNKRLQGKLDEQDRAISTYKVKEEIHQRDIKTDSELLENIEQLREKVNNAKSPEAGAGEISGAINNYFDGNKRS